MNILSGDEVFSFLFLFVFFLDIQHGTRNEQVFLHEFSQKRRAPR